MKKNSFRAIAAFTLAVSLMLTMCACDGKTENDISQAISNTVESSNEYTSENISSQPSETTEQAAPAVTSTESVSSETQQSTRAVDKEDPVVNAAELINAYNSAIRKDGVKCVSVSQKVAKGSLWLGDKTDEKLDLRSADQTALLAKFEKNATSGAALTALNALYVKSVSVNGNVVTYVLKPAQAADSVAQGHSGYLNIIDTDGTKGLVEAVRSYAGVRGEVKIKSSEYTFEGGTLVVAFESDAYDRIEFVTFTGKQTVKAKMQYFIMTINADVDYVLSSKYAKA